MTLLLVIIIGGIAGWIASMIMGTGAAQGPLLNIVVGIIGAVIGGLISGHNLAAGEISFMAFVWAIIGAVILLFIVGLFTRSRRGAV